METEGTLAEKKEDRLLLFTSSIIQAETVICGDQNKDGKTRSMFKIKRNMP
jgi:hypothetical protein